MRNHASCQSRGFTLIELLVVIGIIAVLIGILLPVISGVAARGRDLKCQANLRSIMQAMHGYASEHQGAMPWGHVWNRINHPHWDNVAADNLRCLTWATLVGKYMNKHSDAIAEESTHNFGILYPRALQCPEAEQARAHVVSYVANWIVCIFPHWEMGDEPPQENPGALTRPTRQTQLLKETAVVWDTGILEDWLMDPRWRQSADIDNGRMSFAGPQIPQYRFYTVKDIFAHVPPGVFGQNRPILLNAAQYIYYNREPKSLAEERWPYQGNLRFRHQKETTCNVGFADGSVRQFRAKVNPDKTVKSHDALRRYFMIKWPTGVRPNLQYPH